MKRQDEKTGCEERSLFFVLVVNLCNNYNKNVLNAFSLIVKKVIITYFTV